MSRLGPTLSKLVYPALRYMLLTVFSMQVKFWPVTLPEDVCHFGFDSVLHVCSTGDYLLDGTSVSFVIVHVR